MPFRNGHAFAGAWEGIKEVIKPLQSMRRQAEGLGIGIECPSQQDALLGGPAGVALKEFLNRDRRLSTGAIVLGKRTEH